MNGHPNVLLIVTLASQTPQAKPFNKENENATYEHISQLCEQQAINLFIAHFANTVAYELLCGVTSRVKFIARNKL